MMSVNFKLNVKWSYKICTRVTYKYLQLEKHYTLQSTRESIKKQCLTTGYAGKAVITWCKIHYSHINQLQFNNTETTAWENPFI